MKLVSFSCSNGRSFGIWSDWGVIDLGARLNSRFLTLDAFIASGDMSAAFEVMNESPDHAHLAVELEKPLDTCGKCFCVGVNFPDRNTEYSDGSAAPDYPSVFVRFPESLVGPGGTLIRPPESNQLDYEGEIVIVIGKRGRRIVRSNWAEHVLGFTIGNEGSVRDWIRHGKFNVTPGKNWAGSGSLGPWIVTSDEIPAGPMRVTTRVNGEIRQDDTTDRMIFPFARIVEYISTFCTLQPGDIIFTGTPTGAGARLNPPRFLKPGDEVEVEVPGIGTLRNSVSDE